MIIVKHFLLFINNFAMYKDRYHIGYMTGDLYPKIFFFSNFSKLLLMIYYNKVGNVCSNEHMQSRFCRQAVIGPGQDFETTSTGEGIT